MSDEGNAHSKFYMVFIWSNI
uniref:Uncharacterized protein n=1 Tax=Arundo donax TaxID=35708 RepID=A0A0A9AI49_ARUDO